MPEKPVIQSTTQQFLDIYDITNDVLVLKNGAASIILTVNAINFGLLAEEEQDAVMYQYAALLNSLNYPIQVVVRSQTKDATAYLQLLKDREDQSTDRVKREWIRRYRDFVSNLIYERNVLDKKFYVAIPASYLEMGLTTAQNVVSGFREVSVEGIEKSIILERALNLLEPRRDHLIGQFARIGLIARQLKTQEIIQLFYTSYNAEATEGQQITDSSSYTTPLVQAQIRGVLMNDQSTNPVMPTAPAAPVQSSTIPTPAVSEPTAPTPATPTPTPSAPITTAPANPSVIESPTTTAPATPTPPAPTAPAAPTTLSAAPAQTPPLATPAGNPPIVEAQELINSAAQQVVAPEEEAATPDLSSVQPVNQTTPPPKDAT